MSNAIVLGIVFAALFEICHIVLDVYVIHKIKTKNAFLARVKVVISFVVTGFILYLLFSGFYTISPGQNGVVSTVTGNKKIVDDVGIHYSFMSSVEKLDTRKQMLKYPTHDITSKDEIVTLDEQVIEVSAVTEFQIVDSRKWAIDNIEAKDKLYYNMISLIREKIRANNYDYVINHRTEINEDILNELKEIESVYGISIDKFYLLKTTDVHNVREAKSSAEASRIESEALIDSYEAEAEALQKKYNSIDDKDFIKYMELINALKEGDINTIVVGADSNGIYMIPGGNNG